MKIKRKSKEECDFNFNDLPFNCKFIHNNTYFLKIYKTDSCTGGSALRYSDGVICLFNGDEKCERIEGEIILTDEVTSFRNLKIGDCFKYSSISSSVLMKVYRERTWPKGQVTQSASAIDLFTARFLDIDPDREVIKWHGEFVQK